MRNEKPTTAFGIKLKHKSKHLVAALLGSFTLTPFASDNSTLNNLEMVLDGYAYALNSDVTIDFDQQLISVESELENCLQNNNQAPLTNSNWTLISNNEVIGIEQFRYHIESQLLFLTSETSNVVCDNGLFIDQIFVHGFE